MGKNKVIFLVRVTLLWDPVNKFKISSFAKAMTCLESTQYKLFNDTLHVVIC